MLKGFLGKTLNEIFEVDHYKDKHNTDLKFGDYIDWNISTSYQPSKILRFYVDFDSQGLALIGVNDNNQIDYNHINRIKEGIENTQIKGRIDFPFNKDIEIITI